MRSRLYSFFFLFILIVSCGPKAIAPVNSRVAMVKFDNQAGVLEVWLSSFISALGSHQVQDLILVDDAEGVRQSGVGRVITGRFSKTSKGIRIEARIANATTTAILGSFDSEVSEGELTQTTSRMLEALLGVKTKPEADAKAWVEYAKALAGNELASFVSSHPGFAPAYPVLSRLLIQQGKREEALALVGKFPASGDAYSRAQLSIAVAGNGPERLKALSELASFRKGDPALQLEMAQMAAGIGDWAQAAAYYRELARIEPTKPDWWNSLGYAEANLGKLDKAVEALNEYRRLAPNEANPIDSLGEVNYTNRKFAEAARYFEEQARRYPTFQNGAGLRKAAFARYYAGDGKAADLHFDSWLKQVSPNAVAFQSAMWLARTKRGAEAKALLSKANATLQLAMLEFGLEGKRPSNELLQQISKDAGSSKNELAIFALMVEPRDIEVRISRVVPQPQLAQLRQELLTAARELYGPQPIEKTKLFPLPNAADGPLDALLLRKRIAVLP